MQRRVFLVGDALADEMVQALNDLAAVQERVAHLRQIGYDEADLPFEAVTPVARAWVAIRGYAAERSVSGGMIVAIPVPGHPDDTAQSAG